MSLVQQRRFTRRRTSVGASREFVTGVLTEWRLHTLIEDIRLCVSELATNALLHGVPPGREFSVVLHRAEDQVRMEVRDSGPGHPYVQQATADACSGRGLHLVRELADDSGVDDHVVGKTVWLIFKTAPTTAALP
ncbi:ATP-binding protein [Streptomyces sp. A1277]|uniref:ATP-binding protein n=1 Tax=Streptomyces sp. A1277 TaxID=2563103 RepID=UPI0010A26F0C|nr:ATP-binding protein [Streptomyces sp. A1277]THA22699.1 ATP-binding protein [Streptomyces sp. A1277]